MIVSDECYIVFRYGREKISPFVQPHELGDKCFQVENDFLYPMSAWE